MTIDEIIKSLKEEPEQWQERECFGKWSVESKFHSGAHRIFGVDWSYVNHDNLNEGGYIKFIDRLRLRWVIWRWRKYTERRYRLVNTYGDRINLLSDQEIRDRYTYQQEDMKK